MLTTRRPLRAAVLCSRRAPGLVDLLERDRRRGEAYEIACVVTSEATFAEERRRSGKTAVLEATARAFGRSARLGVLVGDLATDSDARRVRSAGIVAEAITTGSACHLDAEMVHKGLHRLPWRELDYLFIENVGNLVCPAVYDLGQAANVVALSVTEGEDKPLKYPTMFHKADLVLLTKVDLLAALDGDIRQIEKNLTLVMPRPAMLTVSAKTGAGITPWLRWLAGVGRPRGAPCAVGSGAGLA